MEMTDNRELVLPLLAAVPLASACSALTPHAQSSKALANLFAGTGAVQAAPVAHERVCARGVRLIQNRNVAVSRTLLTSKSSSARRISVPFALTSRNGLLAGAAPRLTRTR